MSESSLADLSLSILCGGRVCRWGLSVQPVEDRSIGRSRYSVDCEEIGKRLIEEVFESVGLETDEATRVTITEAQIGHTVSGAGSDEDEALEVACRKMGISPGDLDDEIEEDE